MYVTEVDRGLIREGLLSVSRGVLRLLDVAVAEGSLGAGIVAEAVRRVGGGETLGSLTLSGTALSVRALHEHEVAFVDGIAKGKMTVTLAAIVRSALEVGANAHFVFAADSPTTVLQRQLQLTIDELRFPVRHSEFRTMVGDPIDGRSFREELKAILTEMGAVASADRLPSMSKRVADLLGTMGPPDPIIYSQLSAVSHGGATALGMFVNPASGNFVLHREIAAEYVGYLYVAAVATGARLVEVFGATGRDLERWHGARDRGTLAIDRYRTSVYPDG